LGGIGGAFQRELRRLFRTPEANGRDRGGLPATSPGWLLRPPGRRWLTPQRRFAVRVRAMVSMKEAAEAGLNQRDSVPLRRRQHVLVPDRSTRVGDEPHVAAAGRMVDPRSVGVPDGAAETPCPAAQNPAVPHLGGEFSSNSTPQLTWTSMTSGPVSARRARMTCGRRLAITQGRRWLGRWCGQRQRVPRGVRHHDSADELCVTATHILRQHLAVLMRPVLCRIKAGCEADIGRLCEGL